MKAIFVSGLVILSTTIAMAAPGRAPREVLVDYTKQVREFMYGKGGSAKTADTASVKSKILEHLQLPARNKEIMMSLSGEKGEQRMDSMITIIAAKKMSAEISKSDSAEGQSLNAAAEASAKLIANHYLIGDKPSKELSADQVTLVREALDKAESLPSRILTEFSKAERDSYTQVLERYDNLNQQVSNKSVEDNFVQAIMEVKKVDRTKALEIVRKLKECA